jgi:tRNA threonylcarbamoyladenosine biosynthesis protein TsaE
MKLQVNSMEELPLAAKKILDESNSEKIFVFKGEMGSGKTTLIKELCLQIGVISAMSSPTFSLINEYETNSGEVVYHFDFYRLEDEQEAFDYGYEDYFFSGNYCFIEWPEKIPNLIPDNYLLIEIEMNLQIREMQVTSV